MKNYRDRRSSRHVGPAAARAGIHREESGDEAARVVFLGDYIDRGPNSRAVLDTLMAGPSRPNHVWTPLLGNHDQMMEQALAGDLSALETWFANGAERTIASFGLDADEWHRIPSRYINFIRKLPALFQDDLASWCRTESGRTFLSRSAPPRFVMDP